ncbi:hypothetical protein MNBD_ALPHA11-2195, partial [hydrothermal vent metagenome]
MKETVEAKLRYQIDVLALEMLVCPL